MEQKLQMIAERLNTTCPNSGLLKGKMGIAILFKILN